MPTPPLPIRRSPISTCPKCQFEQVGGVECQRCGVIFSKVKPPVRPNHTQQDHVGDKSPRSNTPGLFAQAYRIVSWLSLVSTVVIILLILRQSPTPSIHADPQVADRVAEKMAQLQTAMHMGQSHSMALNEGELNQWMRDNLVIASAHDGQQAGIPVPTGHEASVQEVQSALKDVRLSLSGNQLRAYAVFVLYGKELSLQLDGAIETRDGFIRLKPTAGKLGSLPIPSSTLDRVVQQLFESPQNRESFRLPPHLTSVHVENSTLVIVTE